MNADHYRLRAFRPSDADDVAALFHAAVHRTAARDYSPDQLRAWSPAPPDPARFAAKGADGRLALVAAGPDDWALAYGDLERDVHLDLLYCHPDHGGRGLASPLCDALEARARGWGVPLVYIEASETARPVFARRGYAVEERRDFERNGVAIHNYRMTRVP